MGRSCRAPRLLGIFASVLCAGLLAPALALAIVPSQGQEVEYGQRITSPCSVVNKQANGEEKSWGLSTVNPRRRHSSGGGEELAPAEIPRPDEFEQKEAEETLYSPKPEGGGAPTGEGCGVQSADPAGAVVEGDELAVYEPGPYVLEQFDFKVHWELLKGSPEPQACENNDQYYPLPDYKLEPPETPPPPEYTWELTSFCNTVNVIRFYVLGGEGLCPAEKQDMSLFPQVPYFNQYDTGSRLNLPVSSYRKGGNACGPSSMLMTMRWNIAYTGAHAGWSNPEIIDAWNALPSMYAAYDATMMHTRAEQGDQSNHLMWEKALRYLRSLGWSRAEIVCLGTRKYIKSKKQTECTTTYFDIAYGNMLKIEEALTEGPIMISTAFSTRRWGLTGGGHVIMVYGADPQNPNDVDVYDPAGNYFSTPKSHYADTSKGGHYGPTSCGYDVPYPLSWLLAYTTGRVFIRLGPAPRTDPPVFAVSDAEPEGATAPDDLYLEDVSGHKAGWVGGEPVEEIAGAFVGQTEDTYTDPGVEDSELGELISEEPIGPPPRSITLNSPQAGTTLHVSSAAGGNFALNAEEWSDGQIVGREGLSGSLGPGYDEVVTSPTLDAAIAASQQQAQQPTGPAGSEQTEGSPSVPALGGGIAVAARIARVRGGRALLKMRCPGSRPCVGQVKLLNHGVIGKARFSIAAGKVGVVKVKLRGKGKALVRKAGKRGLKVTLTGTGVKHRKVVLMEPAWANGA